jgi:hypothetical protein
MQEHLDLANELGVDEFFADMEQAFDEHAESVVASGFEELEELEGSEPLSNLPHVSLGLLSLRKGTSSRRLEPICGLRRGT